MRRRIWLQGWLKPTADLYRHLVTAALSLVVFVVGVFITFRGQLMPIVEAVINQWEAWLAPVMPNAQPGTATHLSGLILLGLGMWGIFQGVQRFVGKIAGQEEGKPGVISDYMRKQKLARGPRVVAIGGGSGLSTLLRGLKQHTSNITAIVTVTDDGGSSGRLVSDLGIIPPGDIRNCLVALADAEKRMSDIFQHRFTKGAGALAGHSVGNLLLAGFIERAGGDVDTALGLASGVLAIRGQVVPSTREHVRLRALLDDGTEIEGETAIVASGKKIQKLYLSPDTACAHPAALKAIEEADVICIGPGSVYTSVIPNLLFPDMVHAITKSRARKFYICNVMTQKGESDSFTAAEHVQAILNHVAGRVFDYVLVNTGTPTEQILHRYREYEQDYVVPDIDRIKHMGFKTVAGNYMSETDYVRHDPFKVATRIFETVEK